MKKRFKKAATIFRYLAILFTIAYWIYVVIDDWNFIQKYWAESQAEYAFTWIAWFAVYFMVFSFYYWLFATIIILVHHRLTRAGSRSA